MGREFDLSEASPKEIFDAVLKDRNAAREMILTMIVAAEHGSGELYAAANRLRDLLSRNASDAEDMELFIEEASKLEQTLQDTRKVFKAVDQAVKYINNRK